MSIAILCSYVNEKGEKGNLKEEGGTYFTTYSLTFLSHQQDFEHMGFGRMLTEKRLEVAKGLGIRKVWFTGTENLSEYYNKVGFYKLTEYELFHGVPQAI